MSQQPEIFCTKSRDGDEICNTINCDEQYKLSIDIHTHIMTGHCTPMPLIWDKIPWCTLKKGDKRTDLDSVAQGRLGKWAKGNLGFHGAQETVENGKALIAKNARFYQGQEDCQIFTSRSKLLSIMIVMPMDMEYGHIDGYEGVTIYYKTKKREYYYGLGGSNYGLGGKKFLPPKPENLIPNDNLSTSLKKELNKKRGRALPFLSSLRVQEETRKNKKGEEEGVFYFWFERAAGETSKNIADREVKWLDEEEFDVFQTWDKQEAHTRIAAVANPWRLLPFFHYEPRRYKSKTRQPYMDIAHPGKGGLYIGIKMYPSLGYKPDDYRLLPNLRGLYSHCESNEIPIMSHCSPDGMYTHERGHYLDFEPDNTVAKEYKNTLLWFDDDLAYFQKNFVHPEAWERVLGQFPDLKLCLAHFGGNEWARMKKYPQESSSWIMKMIELAETKKNFYVDISYFLVDKKFVFNEYSEAFTLILKESKSKKSEYCLLDKILFGTDWYMLEGDKKEYDDYFVESRKPFDKIGKELKVDLWKKFTFINPMNYLGLKNIAAEVKEGLEEQLGILGGHLEFSPLIPAAMHEKGPEKATVKPKGNNFAGKKLKSEKFEGQEFLEDKIAERLKIIENIKVI